MNPAFRELIRTFLCSAILAGLACACANPVNNTGAYLGPVEGGACVQSQDNQACLYKGTASSTLRCEAGSWRVVAACPPGSQCLQGPGASGKTAACVPVADVADTLSVGTDAGTQDQLDGDTQDLGTDTGTQDLLDGDAPDLPKDGLPAPEPCACLQPGMTFRFDKWQIKSLDGDPAHMAIGTLNPLWQGDIDKKELNFYMEVKEVSATEVQLRIVNGARIDKAGNVCTLPVTGNTVIMQRNGCKIQNAAPTALNIFAGTPANPKNCTTGLAVPHAIPVRNVLLSAEIAPTCAAVANGLLIEGAISSDSLDNTCTCMALGGKPAEDCGTPNGAFAGYASSNNEAGQPPEFCTDCCKGCNDNFTNLKELLNMFANDGGLQYKCKDEKGKPAVCLAAEFSAVKAVQLPANCPQ